MARRDFLVTFLAEHFLCLFFPCLFVPSDSRRPLSLSLSLSCWSTFSTAKKTITLNKCAAIACLSCRGLVSIALGRCRRLELDGTRRPDTLSTTTDPRFSIDPLDHVPPPHSRIISEHRRCLPTAKTPLQTAPSLNQANTRGLGRCIRPRPVESRFPTVPEQRLYGPPL